ncbi:MAG: hypothetical protein KKA54_08865 [Proteobacteria bacterium]|nr:hypothetical protein [Pseudomonadota bacterium]
MKKISMLASAILMSWMLIAPAMGQQQTPPEEPGNPANGEASVSQTQVDIYKQREEARQRRDELLKMRSQTIDAAGQQDSTAQPQDSPTQPPAN